SGPDTLNVGDSSGVQDIQGSLTVNSAVADSVDLILDDRGDGTGRTVTMVSGLVRGLAPADIVYGQQALANLTVYGGAGGNTFDVLSTPAPGFVPLFGLVYTDTTINCSGADTVNVGDSMNRLDSIQGPLSIDGQGGSAVLNVNDQGAF